MKRNYIGITIFLVLFAAQVFGQAPRKSPAPSPTPRPPAMQTTITTGGGQELPRKDNFQSQLVPPLETILRGAEKQTQNYQETFKNLLATETKTFEKFDKNGTAGEQVVVESNFFINQSARDKNVSSELRNVVKVDGKEIPDSQKRSEAFFAELQKTNTVEKELEKIQSEGSRYDKTLEISGLTLSEAVVLSNNLRPFFDFKLLSSENFQGNDVFVVGYQQTKKSPFISVNGKGAGASDISLNFFDFNLPKKLKKADVFLRGKLWIDAKTFQIWREERELTVQTPNPVVILENTFEYQRSDYGILVPKKITLLANEVKKNSKENQFTAVKDTKVDFDYSRFRKSDVDVKVLDDN